MKRFLRNLPIKHKLTAITMTISGVALLIACAAFAIIEQATFRRTMARDFATMADIFDENVASGLAFNDTASIEHTLNTLKEDRRILAAAVFDKAGVLAASYQQAELKGGFGFPAAEPSGQRWRAMHLDTFKDIELAGEVIGVVYIATDLSELRKRAWRYAAIVAVLLVGCSVVSLVLATRLQRIISQPIEDLAQTVATVAAGKNYAVRAHKESDDELGRLIDGFNEMLVQIQTREAALGLARTSLEKRVEERTAELARENLERRRAEAELREKTALLEAQADASIDGILVVDNEGRKLFQNQRTLDLWKIPPDIAGQQDDEKQIRFVMDRTKDPARFAAKVKQLYAHPTESSRDEIEFKDGMVLDRYSAPVVGKDGKRYGRIWSFRDITERKRAEEELGKMHQELVETSRHAGMAEIATGVLHNVGNVLNSVNVSATLVADQVQHSKAGNIGKLAVLVDQHRADLAGFLTADPRGRMIPAYLGTLAESIAAEQAALVKELEHLRQNVAHIKEIVAMQQSYARTSGAIETVSVPDLVEDALRINAGSLARHEVDTLRDYQARPVITTDKHKVMQILINLVRNAKYACDESGRTDKRITVRTTTEGERIRIAVIDNGVGIPAENLTRIFNHGFTTRATGHGFGLHSGALAARDLGGSLEVHSAGPGQGATFVLELPSKPSSPAP